MQAADHLDDEDDVEDEETALENFTTSVDNEETDEYIAFRNSLQGEYRVGVVWFACVSFASAKAIEVLNVCVLSVSLMLMLCVG